MSHPKIICEICIKEFQPRWAKQKACSPECSRIRSNSISVNTALKQDERSAAFGNKFLKMERTA